MEKIQRFLKLFFIVFFLSIIIQSTFTSFAETEQTVNVDVRVESYNKTVVPEMNLDVTSFDLQEYVGSSKPILSDSPRAIHAIIQALEQSGDNQLDLKYGGNYIAGINGLYEFDRGPMSGWMYYIDNEFVPVGVLEHKIEDGDSIVVFYVENYTDNTFAWFKTNEIVVEAGKPFNMELTGVNYNNISPVDGATILVNEKAYKENDEQVVTDENGNLTMTLDKPGEYTLSAERLKNDYRNITRPYAKVTVTKPKDETPPEISVEGMTDGLEVNEPSLKFSVEASDDQSKAITLSATLNEEPIEIKNDQQNEIYLNEGRNLIVITAKDEAGNKATERYEIFYQAQENDDESDSDSSENEGVSIEKIKHAIDSASQYILTKGVKSDWEAIAIARTSHEIPEEYNRIFHQNLQDQVIDRLENNRIKITDIERLTIAAVALDLNPQNINGFNLIEKIYNSPIHVSGTDTMTLQGNNGLAFALIALDTLGFEIPSDAKWNRQAIIDKLLASQNSDGSWPLNEYFASSDIDITGMVITGLSQYTDNPEVSNALERAIEWLTEQQLDNGGFFAGDFVGGVTSETTSQVIIGLSSYGIDASGNQFTKNKNSLVDHLLTYQNDDGGFKHTQEDSRSDVMATEQALQALIAYYYYLTGEGSLYQFDQKEQTPDENDNEDSKEESEDQEHPFKDETRVVISGTTNKNKVMNATITMNEIKNISNRTLDVQPKNAKKQHKLVVKLENDVIDSLIENKNDLKINKEKAVVHIPTEILSQLSKQSKGAPVTIQMEKYSADYAVGSVYDFTIKAGDTKVSNFGNNEITLTLQVSQQEAENPQAYYFNEQTNEWEHIDSGKYNSKTGTISFQTNHFSIYGVFDGTSHNFEKPTQMAVNNSSEENKRQENLSKNPTEPVGQTDSVNLTNSETSKRHSNSNEDSRSTNQQKEQSVQLIASSDVHGNSNSTENDHPSEKEEQEASSVKDSNENKDQSKDEGDTDSLVSQSDEESEETDVHSQESSGQKQAESENTTYGYWLALALFIILGAVLILYYLKKNHRKHG
ncbi:DUF4430 domain-containing protein [Allobacillus sp. GCM10007491]|uniref:DUF4430 domain-containing protein n=1 Tax=Allobacillus saliphilus TaxID=2912308 RepID=A0A941HRY8_9BACI|nr:DUF4430 domain-containing protein [Allobacillus saliphilus]MBR7552863.1 DUF4430 domain-containing protein [Allobacillus saliphilus]